VTDCDDGRAAVPPCGLGLSQNRQRHGGGSWLLSFVVTRQRQALGDLGYTEGRNYIMETRFADTDRARLPALAKELVAAGVDVIVTIGTPTVGAAKEATVTIPIIMAGSTDPVELGLVASLAHPGGNVTGVTHNPGPGFTGKGLQLLKEAAPNTSRVAVLATSQSLDQLAAHLKVTILVHEVGGVRSRSDFDAILSKVIEEHADALFVSPDFVNGKYQSAISDFVSTNRLPCMCQNRPLVEAGCLLYYYTDFFALRRRAAAYVDKIFKGTKPADLPVEQPSKFQLIVNLKTARALGLTVPQSILAGADELIE